MDLNQLVHASEVLENLQSIKNEIEIKNKRLSQSGKQKIDEIINDCCNALSKTCECGNRGQIEFERINTLILETCIGIKTIVEPNSSFSEVLAL